jgi:hypothetical protein
MSWIVRLSVTRASSRSDPDRLTAWMARLPPTRVPVNQIWLPSGTHASPWTDEKTPASDRAFPERSTSMTEPPSSRRIGWSRNATVSPFGETRGWLIQPDD